MYLSIKPGVSVRGIRPELVLALFISQGVLDELWSNPGRITSCTDGKHSPGSLHYVGLAADIGIRELPPGVAQKYCDQLKIALGAEFDVVLESDHIHLEYQPKGPIE